ncbi:hypothetical protein BT96DRAFT_1002158 [Gymnopus androsaceus JB14]|uniref:JmjC domain-containing protein n=1 Tax=Gymnopus androsaceus JB14 TaxID=1447944 RepID=A0A6A4GZQ5_9AGAR|nr:hypothetical protein BT96DRAFT_1002158 [Gymnopus androsaceus JB14]
MLPSTETPLSIIEQLRSLQNHRLTLITSDPPAPPAPLTSCIVRRFHSIPHTSYVSPQRTLESCKALYLSKTKSQEDNSKSQPQQQHDGDGDIIMEGENSNEGLPTTANNMDVDEDTEIAPISKNTKKRKEFDYEPTRSSARLQATLSQQKAKHHVPEIRSNKKSKKSKKPKKMEPINEMDKTDENQVNSAISEEVLVMKEEAERLVAQFEPLQSNFSLASTRKYAEAATLPLYHMDGTKMVGYKPNYFLKSNADKVEELITRVNETLLENRLIQFDVRGVADGETKELPKLASVPRNHPIYQVTHQNWESMPAKDKQALLRAHLCVHITQKPHTDLEFSEENLESLLGNIHQVREMHDSSLESDEDLTSSHVFTNATFCDMVHLAQTGGKSLNCLDIPRVTRADVPMELATNLVAELATAKHPGFSNMVTVFDESWALCSLPHSLHTGHMDDRGYLTGVKVIIGEKYWIIAQPKEGVDLGSIHAFDKIQGLFDSKDWTLFAVILTPGDILIMRPLVPHTVLTTKPTVCYGWHSYCAQNLRDTALGIFQSFIYSSRVTNTHHVDGLQGLQRMLVYWLENVSHYKHPTNADEVFPHQLNLLNVEDVIGLVMVCNIATLGTILDYRRYLPVEEGGLLPDMWIRYSLTKKSAEDLLEWVYPRYYLVLTKDGQRRGQKDLPHADRLRILRIKLLVQQCKALIIHSTKEDAGGPGYKVVTSEDLQATIETDFSEDASFMALWPDDEEWERIRENPGDTFTYSFPLPPNGCKYAVECTQVS